MEDGDYRKLTAIRYYFSWKAEKKHAVYKLRKVDDEDILGVIALQDFPKEERIEIRLLAVSRENRGAGKQYERITGVLLAYACLLASRYGRHACVSLFPKTALKQHYIQKYGMQDIRIRLFVEGPALYNIILGIAVSDCAFCQQVFPRFCRFSSSFDENRLLQNEIRVL